MRRLRGTTYRDWLVEDLTDALLEQIKYQTPANPFMATLKPPQRFPVHRDLRDKTSALRQLHEAEEAVRLAFR